jgi:hypothetical protein
VRERESGQVAAAAAAAAAGCGRDERARCDRARFYPEICPRPPLIVDCFF